VVKTFSLTREFGREKPLTAREVAWIGNKDEMKNREGVPRKGNTYSEGDKAAIPEAEGQNARKINPFGRNEPARFKREQG